MATLRCCLPVKAQVVKSSRWGNFVQLENWYSTNSLDNQHPSVDDNHIHRTSRFSNEVGSGISRRFDGHSNTHVTRKTSSTLRKTRALDILVVYSMMMTDNNEPCVDFLRFTIAAYQSKETDIDKVAPDYPESSQSYKSYPALGL